MGRARIMEDAFPPVEGACAYCHGPLPKRRRRWCSDACWKKACIESNYGIWQHHLAELRGFKCEDCGCSLPKEWWKKDGAYHIHHIVRFADGGTHALDNLLVLCRGCHKAEHASRKVKEAKLQGEMFGGLE